MGREHWIDTTLGVIATHPQYGWTTKATRKGKFKYFRTTDIDTTIDWDRVPYCANIPKCPDDYIIKKNDILVSRAGSVGYSIRFEDDHFDTLFASYLIRFRPITPIDSKLIEYYLQTKEYWLFISDSQAGIAVPNVNASKLADLPFPLPPLNEQKRIVEKLDAILPKVKSAKARLEQIPRILKKFRQSVLAAACSGRLTEDWREEYSASLYGKSLLNEIRKRRQEYYEKISSQYEKDGKRKPRKPILVIPNETERCAEIPTTWIECSIGDIGDVLNGATPSRPKKDYWNGNIPWVSSGLVQNNRINSVEERITQKGYDNSSVKLLPKGTVLLAMIGEGKTRGQSAILDIDATINQNVAGIIISHGLILSEYLQHWFMLNYIKNRDVGSGTGPQALNCDRVRELPFVLPPYKEQKEIAYRVDKLFTLIKTLETRYHNAIARVEKIEQAVLAKAFRGELVEADPNDEPAAELLKRILVEKERIGVRKKK